MATEVFNRYEHKYLIDGVTFEKTIKILDEHMDMDSHNKDHIPYTISNIYFDTPDDYLIRTSLSKPDYKEKLRLRSYGVPDADSKVFLEIKKKYKGIVNKRRTTLRLSEAYDFVTTGKAPEPKEYMNTQVLHEIEYFLKVYDLYPKLYLAYDRIAYFERDNKDLRISFDMNIRSRRYDLALDKGDYGEKLLPDDMYLMEIKTSLAKPLWLTHMLDELNIKRRSFSKYGTEYKNMINRTDIYETEQKHKEVV
ncbi:MAG: polyphosphate polymerase domain-containing protein [Clostridia bacterium]|nr:polyphosphate polymerase domain-containing protein [Clostridia bacterium]